MSKSAVELERLHGDGTRVEQLQWGRLLGYVRAELGEFEAAVAQLESVDEIDGLEITTSGSSSRRGVSDQRR